MIYQCFANPGQAPRLFLHRSYAPFGLEPEVNSELFERCPELEDQAVRLQLLEFAAMLWLWRNPPDDGHDWIGFTSWRQLDKTTWKLRDGKHVEELLAGDIDAVAWMRLTFDYPLAVQAEESLPGMSGFFARMLNAARPGRRGLLALGEHTGFFASYWLMGRVDFDLFMTHWLGPCIGYVLDRLKAGDDPYLLSHPRAAAHALERVFCAWAQVGGRRVREAQTGKVWTAGVVVD